MAPFSPYNRRMGQFLNLRLALYVAAVLLALFGVGNAFVALFVQSRHEVVWHFDVTARFCSHGQCAYVAELEVANTGKEVQPQVAVSIKPWPRGLGAAPTVLNLDAGQPRDFDPVIEQSHDNGQLAVQVKQFAPGTLVQFAFRGLIPEADLVAALDPQVSVTGQGRMIEGDPRGIALGRFFTREEYLRENNLLAGL